MTTNTKTAGAVQRAVDFYGKHHWRIFPVAAGAKRPLTPRGFLDGTDSAETLDEWWRTFPNANIGLWCNGSGLVVLDCDPAHYGEGTAEFVQRLMDDYPTCYQDTPTGGLHLFYMPPPGAELTNRTGSLPPGIDVRANGYVLLAPSTVTYRGDDAAAKGVADGHTGRYTWQVWPKDIPPQPLPDHVYELLTRAPTPPPAIAPTLPPPPKATTNGNGNGHHAPPDRRYAEAALERELDALARARAGTRNNQLNRTAFALGQLVAGGELDERRVRAMLETTAAAIGLEAREITATVDSGLAAGMKHPRSAPTMPVLKFRAVTVNPVTGETERKPETAGEYSLFDYRPEDGGILDAWLDTLAENWMYVTGYEAWYQWLGTHWQADDQLVMELQVQELMDAMNRDAKTAAQDAARKGDKNALAMAQAYISATKRTRGRVSSVEGMARAARAQTPSTLDRGNRLNLFNGALNLDTLVFEAHDRDHNATYCLPYEYDWNAGCPRFRQFIREVLVKEDGRTPDEELAMLFQELVGYSLTTDTRHEVMVWLSGNGSNGKTVAITVLARLLGRLAVSVDFQTLGTAGNYDLADLPGARVIFSTESERGGGLAEGHIKRIVSGETIRARAIYGKPFAFQSTAKIWWAMNDTPSVRDTSNAMWRRLKLFPFRRTFTDAEKDTGLIDKLIAELPGILNWAIEGLSRLRANGGFTVAGAVGAAIEEYRYESNPVAQWMAEQTQRDGGETQATACHQSYTLWATRNGGHDLSSVQFARELARLGVNKAKKRTGWFYGLTLQS